MKQLDEKTQTSKKFLERSSYNFSDIPLLITPVAGNLIFIMVRIISLKIIEGPSLHFKHAVIIITIICITVKRQ